MKKYDVVTVTGIVLLTVLLGGCSQSKEKQPDNGPSDYCQLLEKTRADVERFNFATMSDESFVDLLSKVDDLEQGSSGETQQAWATLSTALEDLQSALAEANLSVSDLPQLAQGQVPNGADTTKLAQVTQQIQTLSSDPALQKASAYIQKNAQSACDITLGSTPSPGESTPS